MKNLSLSILAILFAGASVIANVPVHTKIAKKAGCTTCAKAYCTKKASCPNTANCIFK